MPTAPHAQDMSQTISLLTTTTGLVDIYLVAIAGEPEWVIPQNLVLEISQIDAQATTIEWEGQAIPIQSFLPDGYQGLGTLVVLEGQDDQHRIGVLTQATPKSMRIRISSLHDTNDAMVLPYAYQKVLLDQNLYQVPDIDRLTAQLVATKTPN
jgi:hypothetical protein